MSHLKVGDNIIYLEGGRLQLGELTNIGDKKSRIITKYKVKRKIDNNKIITIVDQQLADSIIKEAISLAKTLDMEKIWELTNGQEITTTEIAKRLNINCDQAVIFAALNLNQVRNGGFFKLQNDKWLPVDQKTFAKIKIAVAHRQERYQLEKQFKNELAKGNLPPILQETISNYLINKIDPNNVNYRFLLRYCKKQSKSLAQLAFEFNLISNLANFHARECILEIPKEKTDTEVYNVGAIKKNVLIYNAIAIDAHGTIEVDDAFSLQRINDNTTQLNICVACPSLGISTIASEQANERMITVYIPGKKYTMFPKSVIDYYSLNSNQESYSLTLRINLDSKKQVVATDFAINKIEIKHNLSIESFHENQINYDGLDAQSLRDIEEAEEISKLLNLSKPRDVTHRGHLVRLENEKVIITNRENLAIIDDLIANQMIYYNQCAAKYLNDKGYIFVGRHNGKSSISSTNRPIDYGWFTSPLRRIIDLLNQQQLLAAIKDEKPVYTSSDLYKIIPLFEKKFQWAKKQQCKLDKYWTLKHMKQSKNNVYPGTITKQADHVMLKDVPVIAKIQGSNLAPETEVAVEITDINLFELTATGKII